jgi:hypothetical protein
MKRGSRSELRTARLDKHGGVILMIETELRPPLSATLLAHADRRGVAPGELLASLIEAVLGDDLIDAVLDDRPVAK